MAAWRAFFSTRQAAKPIASIHSPSLSFPVVADRKRIKGVTHERGAIIQELGFFTQGETHV